MPLSHVFRSDPDDPRPKERLSLRISSVSRQPSIVLLKFCTYVFCGHAMVSNSLILF